MDRLMNVLVVIMFATVALVGACSSAEASRPMPGYRYPDVCKNIKGYQPIFAVKGATARYRFITRTPRPNDCRPLRWYSV